MRCFCLLFALLVTASSVFGQESEPPFAVARGELVRLALSDRLDGAPGSFYVGSVAAVDADSISLVLRDREFSLRAVGWSEISHVERLGENRTGEALGLLIGGLAGGALGYILGDVLIDDPVGKVALLPGALIGLTAGGFVGARVGNRWEEVPPVQD